MRDRWSPPSLSGEEYFFQLLPHHHRLSQEAGAGAAVGDCADLRQDRPGPRHRARDAAHDDHEEEDAEEEDAKQDKIVILS